MSYIVACWEFGYLAAVLLLAVFRLSYGGRPFTYREWALLFLGAVFWPFVLVCVVVER